MPLLQAMCSADFVTKKGLGLPPGFCGYSSLFLQMRRGGFAQSASYAWNRQLPERKNVNQEMIDRLIRVREHIDSLEVETLHADPDKLNAYADELAAMCSELHAIYDQETAEFRELGEEYKAQAGQDDLNALEETLEAAEETMEVIEALREQTGDSSEKTYEKITSFEQDMQDMHQHADDLAALEEEQEYSHQA